MSLKQIIEKELLTYDICHISRRVKILGLENEIIINTSFLPNTSKLSQRIYHILNDLNEYPKCLNCNKTITKFRNMNYGYNKFCCQRCGTIYNKETREQTKLKKYGDKKYNNPSKNKKTQLEKYGVEHFNQLPKQRERIKKQCILRSEEHKNKLFNQLYNSFFDDRLDNKFKPLFKLEDYKGSNYKYNFLCLKCNNIVNSYIHNGKIPRCLICDPITYAQTEGEILNYIKSIYSKNVINNTKRIISPLELDIYLPEKSLAIEFDGLYWHSENSGEKDKKYHLNKTEQCLQKNIRLVHIFEDEWIYKKQIVKNRLKNILGLTPYKIYGRKCEIREIDSKLKNKFLNKYHIQGEDKSKIKLGAYYKNRLVAIMTFSGSRISLGHRDKKQWELIRFCTIGNFSVIGIAGKLLKYFERNYNHESIISYADRRWSDGSLYRSLGFNETHISLPNYWYIINDKRKHRFNYRKNILHKRLNNFDNELSEWDNMQLNGYDRIWDCGNYVFIKYS